MNEPTARRDAACAARKSAIGKPNSNASEERDDAPDGSRGDLALRRDRVADDRKRIPPMSELEDAIVQARRDVVELFDEPFDSSEINARFDAALARLERLVRLAGHREHHCCDHDPQDTTEVDGCHIEAEIAEAVK